MNSSPIQSSHHYKKRVNYGRFITTFMKTSIFWVRYDVSWKQCNVNHKMSVLNAVINLTFKNKFNLHKNVLFLVFHPLFNRIQSLF